MKIAWLVEDLQIHEIDFCKQEPSEYFFQNTSEYKVTKIVYSEVEGG
jgi:hypothetical protein